MSQKFTILSFVMALISTIGTAQTPGDTLTISSHESTHMDWFKNYDEMTNFPTTGSFKKIIMEYSLKCPSGGCSDWDYTTQINVINPTGVIDSTLKQAPNFKVDGNQIDTFYFSTSQTFGTSFNSTTNMTDTTASDTLEVVLYEDLTDPTLPTDTIYVFNANFENYLYDTNGVSIDTSFVQATDTLYKILTPYYKYFEVKDKIELGRAITPYANGFSQTWKRTYLFDVTEFTHLLKGDKTIQAHYSGWSDGFSATVDFHFIYGTPPRDIIDLFPLWHASPKYGQHIDGVHTIENTIHEKEYDRAGAKYTELTFTPTGHGFGGDGNPENCAEFCAKTFDVISNGVNIGQETMWKDDCGENALFPQPGTWLYDRANWCPGEQVRKFNFDLTPSSNMDNNTIDVNFQNYTSGNQGSYTIDAYIATYGEFNFQNNISIERILAPSNDIEHLRFNPICGSPIFTIKNLGEQNITSASFEYGISGEFTLYYYWSGNLSPLQEETITLPAMNAFNFAMPGSNQFFVRASNLNGVLDEDPTDNEKQSTFETVKDFPTDFRVRLKTNSAGHETSWSISDMDNNVLFSQNSPASSQTHYTEISLTQGCYKFEVLDSGKDGLNFPFSPDGSGSIKLVKATSNGSLQSFNANFGSKIEYYFTVSTPFGEKELIDETDIVITPNPSNGKFSIDLPENSNFNNLIIFDAAGRKIHAQEIVKNKMNINIENAKNGVYFMEFSGSKRTFNKKIVISN